MHTTHETFGTLSTRYYVYRITDLYENKHTHTQLYLKPIVNKYIGIQVYIRVGIHSSLRPESKIHSFHFKCLKELP